MKISRIRADSGIPIWKNSIILMMILIGSLHPSAASNKHPHYTFALPDRYIGWVQVVFNDPQASPLPRRDHGYLIEVPESGISRTSDIRVEDYKAKDESDWPNGHKEYADRCEGGFHAEARRSASSLRSRSLVCSGCTPI